MILEKIKAHGNNIAWWHTIFDLPFAFMGALLATHGNPDPIVLFWIAIAVSTGRAAAMAIDNLAHLEFDKKQDRLSYRAMVSGKISKSEAKIFIGIMFLAMIFSVAQLPPICLKLLPIAAIPFVIYPFTKRFTGLCHFFLGFAISMSPAGGYIAAGGSIDLPMILLCSAVALWIGTFDAMYGAQDEEFDRSQNLHSLAVSLGGKRAFEVSKYLHAITILIFIALGIVENLSLIYFVGVGIATIVLIYQHRIISYDDFSNLNPSYFLRNGIVSTVIVLCTFLSYLK